MTLDKLLEQVGIEKNDFDDLHITRFFSAFVAVSNGKVIKVTDPFLKYCPLASMLYSSIRKLTGSGPPRNPPDAAASQLPSASGEGLRLPDNSRDGRLPSVAALPRDNAGGEALSSFRARSDAGLMKKAIAKAVEEKISEFGSFTKRRELYKEDIAVPYGASEMMMYAMRKKIIDAAVIVCDGAGTVIVDRPGVLQGIGARMNGLFYTSPIPEITGELERNGCRVVFPDAAPGANAAPEGARHGGAAALDAAIGQIKGLEKAAQLGYKNIAVTINGYMDEDLAGMEKIEKKYGVSITSFIVCTTGVTVERVREITQHSDLVWSCASREIREITGQSAILQLSVAIPVFVMTEKGVRLAAGYSPDEEFLKKLDLGRQYLVSSSPGGRQIGMGNFPAYLTEQKLPVASRGGWPGPRVS